MSDIVLRSPAPGLLQSLSLAPPFSLFQGVATRR